MGRTASVERDIVIGTKSPASLLTIANTAYADDVPEAVAEHEQLDDDVCALTRRAASVASYTGYTR